MSAIVIHPRTEPAQYDDWKEEITDTVNLFYERVNDTYDADPATLKCLVYNIDNDGVVLLFPLHRIEDADEISDVDHLSAIPSFSIPSAEMTRPTSDYLGVDVDVQLQDLDLRSGLSLFERRVQKGNPRPSIDSMYKEWMENNLASEEETSILDLSSRMMRISVDEYESFKLDRISTLASELTIPKKITCKYENIISDVFRAYLEDSTIYSGKHWWRFIGGRWKDKRDKHVWNLISGNFHAKMGRMQDLEILSDVKDYLGSYHSRTRLDNDLKRKLVDHDFARRLDSDNKKIGMLNGVFDTDDMSLNDPVPADFISMTTNVRFVHRYIEDDGLKIMNILEKVFPRPDVLKFFIRSCASIIEGHNKYKLFYVWWGPSGNNGKSILQGFLLRLFGDYATLLSPSLITGGRAASSGVTPDIADMRNKRLIVLCEPDPTDKIRSGIMKGFSGNDLVYFRKLFGDGDRMEIMGKLILVTNNALESLGRDKAFRSRMTVIPFESTFTEDGLPDRFSEHTFERDYDVEDNLWSLRETFMTMILNDFVEFKKHGPQIPDSVKVATNRYISENNKTIRYIQQKVARRAGSRTHLTELYASYRRWMEESYPGRKVDDLEMFRSELLNDYEVRGNIVIDIDYDIELLRTDD